ncbi:MAG: S1 RNA-binding domain-containing protein, partial [Bacteroidota bacterium]
INGISEFGVFVELEGSFVEGMISYDHMDESYNMDAGRLSITGRRSGKRLKMGDRLRIRVLDADLTRRRVDLALVEVLQVNVAKGNDKSNRKKRAQRGRKPTRGSTKKRNK